MGAILAGAKDPVDLFRCRIVATDGFGGLGSEPEFSARKCEAMRAAQCSQIDYRQCFLLNEIYDGYGVVGATAVIGNVCKLPVIRGGYFVRVGAGRHAGDNG